MDRNEIIKWLLSGDVSIQYQVHRDLLGVDRDALRNRIAREGWGRRYLSLRKPDGHWGIKYYQPKWTSSHYTLMDLKNLAISPENEKIKATIEIIVQQEKLKNSGTLPIGKDQRCDVCLNGMFLNFASYFKTNAEDLRSIIDFILDQNMPDGGFNCEFNRRGAKHSSLHSTLSVLEGITEFKKNGYTYRLADLSKVKNSSVEAEFYENVTHITHYDNTIA